MDIISEVGNLFSTPTRRRRKKSSKMSSTMKMAKAIASQVKKAMPKMKRRRRY